MPLHYEGEPSEEIRRVADTIARLGDTTRHAVAAELGVSLDEVTRAIEELRARGPVERLDSGRFRYVGVDSQGETE